MDLKNYMNIFLKKLNSLHLAKLILFALLVFPAQMVFSAGFRLVPLKLFFDAGNTSSSLKIVNDSKDNVTVQLEAKSWSQDSEGKDVYSATSDIIFFPKIVNIGPEDERVIRVGYQGGPVTDVEKSYRLFVQELPIEQPGEVAMKFVVRMGIPVFVRPGEDKQEWNTASIGMMKDGVALRVNNEGNRYLQVSSMHAIGKNNEGGVAFNSEKQGWYVLAGQGRNFILPVKKQECIKSASINMDVTVNKEMRNLIIDMNDIDCSILNTSEAAVIPQ